MNIEQNFQALNIEIILWPGLFYENTCICSTEPPCEILYVGARLESRLDIALARVPSRTSLRLMAKKGDGTHINVRTTEKDYTLDSTEALEKKVEACDRATVSFQMKPCKNFDATFNTSAYELYRQISQNDSLYLRRTGKTDVLYSYN